jgi:cell division GTPase FtsZ
MFRFGFGILLGAIIALVIAAEFEKQGRPITAHDLVEAYNQGEKAALNAEKPSERLEAVCAALWLKGAQHDK